MKSRSGPVVLCLIAVLASAARGENTPRLADDRLQLSLFAADPEIVTPVGMAIDRRDRIFVIESHTHHPPADYDGPKSDRIKLFVDSDNDGRPEQATVFADGIHQAMNLAFSPAGDLYVVCAREVLRLVDTDDDGVCDRREQILRLVTPERYAHNSLLGITFDRMEWMYVSRGNVASHHYRLEGADDTAVEGYGDGGNVVRCRADGTRLEEFATGFWNPFDLKFDRHGRLLLVDNDPDARGPNRLVQVVAGGDYGYKSLYGGGGNHPFQGWDGTLPGTLPYLAATGEAPSGLLDCRRSSLPDEYTSSVLATIWNENSIERFDLHLDEHPPAVKKSVFMSGPQDFRPVALDCDSRGNLFITDWVLVNYPNHGRGRIWRVKCDIDGPRIRPQSYFAPYLPDPIGDRRAALSTTGDQTLLIDSLTADDPLLRHAARRRLSGSGFDQLRSKLAGHDDARVRLGALLAEKKANFASVESIRAFLPDADVQVRRAALMWAGESMQPQLRAELSSALAVSPVTPLLLETYLAAVQNLDPRFIEAYHARATARAKHLPRRLDPKVLIGVAGDVRYSDDVRSLAIRGLDDATAGDQIDWLLEHVGASSEKLATAAMRRLADMPETDHPIEIAEALIVVALGDARSADIRCEAILALSGRRVSEPQTLLPLLTCPERDVAIETARTFRAWLDAGWAADCVEPILQMRLADEVREPLFDAMAGGLFGESSVAARPESMDQWRAVLETGGSPARGRRVFATSRVGCAKCHTVDGRGGVLGPDLSRVAQSKSRMQIVDAILSPSAEFPPQYQAWIVETTDGRLHRGLQLDHLAGGAIALLTEDGENVRFEAGEIESYQASLTSLMPTGLSETMSVREFKDLVAFMESLK